MELIAKTKIKLLKSKVRRHYLGYHAALDNLSCGKELGEIISSDASYHKVEFNKIMDELAKIDPTCPAIRL